MTAVAVVVLTLCMILVFYCALVLTLLLRPPEVTKKEPKDVPEIPMETRIEIYRLLKDKVSEPPAGPSSSKARRSASGIPPPLTGWEKLMLSKNNNGAIPLHQLCWDAHVLTPLLQVVLQDLQPKHLDMMLMHQSNSGEQRSMYAKL